MSQYKAALRQQQPADSLDNAKHRAQAQQLQELFPHWTNDDLLSLLAEVHGDVELAATRISEGNAEQWGSVSRKKDKKAPASAHASKESFSARGDSRGARGGRGGRGGPGRGGATGRGRGGPPRGGAVNGRSPRVGSPTSAQVDGPAASTASKDAPDSADASAPEPVVPEPTTTQQNGVASQSAWTDASSSQPGSSSLPASSSWAANASSTRASDNEPNGSAPSVSAAPTKPVSTPATSKKSWAQIARPQEKPAPPPVPVPVVAPAAPSQPPAPAPQPPAPEPEAEPESQSWEEPTTVQAPTWEDEPQPKPATTTTETWPSPTVEEPQAEQSSKHEAEVEPTKELPPAEPEKQQIPASKSEPAPIAALATPVISQPAAATPSPKLAGRPAATTRAGARYKNIDQPVVMPSSFGSGIEKVGMQFGSLSLGGESIFDANPSEPEAPTAAPEAPSAPAAQVPAAQELPPPPPPATAPAASTASGTIFSQQQQTQQQPSAIQTLHTLPSSVPQPSQQLPAHVSAAASPIQQFAQQSHQQAQQTQNHQAQQQQQHSLSSVHQQQLLQQQPQQPLNQYNQHALPTHMDPSQQQLHSQQQTSHSNYFGGRGDAGVASAPYFHTPTPPSGQVQDSPYGSFGQLGGQPQHQQASHLGGFSQDYNNYGDNQRSFYDTYQQGAFGNRNVLGHDDVKGLPGSQQQPPTTGGIPSSTTQGAQPHGSLQAGGQPQPAGGQAPQQYPVPYPYGYYPQGQQYFSYSPSYAAVPQPFKYPTMYQPPSGPASAASPVGKQGAGVGALPQGNPYSQGLYPQGYDDYQSHAHHSQHSQPHSHSLGLNQGGVGAGEYGKQLYGGGNQGMQGFMGLGGQGAGAAGGPASNAGGPRGAGSPETPYKPYAAAKDVGSVTAGRGAGQQGQGQSQPQGQGHGGQVPQGQGFYGGARFGGAGAGGVGGAGGAGGPQQNAHHPQNGPQGHPGYPQSGNEGNFYQYRGQQQGYWQ
ncbi:hypothetical protein H0H92_002954 [Tricholoma furcatifolium]|nr:hypothetical protein H0H92_002954 [Tricholoma furcatifolium]